MFIKQTLHPCAISRGERSQGKRNSERGFNLGALSHILGDLLCVSCLVMRGLRWAVSLGCSQFLGIFSGTGSCGGSRCGMGLRFYSFFSNEVCCRDEMFRGILWGLGGIQPLCFLASWLLAPLWPVAGNLWPCYFWKTQQVGKTILLSQLKRKRKKKRNKPTENIWFGVTNQQGSSVSFVSLHLGPIKYITYLFLALFSKKKKTFNTETVSWKRIT